MLFLNLKEKCVIYLFIFFIIVKCIWKVCLFRNILSFKIIALTKEQLMRDATSTKFLQKITGGYLLFVKI